MSISRITSMAADASRQIGRKIAGSATESGNTGKLLRKANHFFQGEGINPGRGAYYFLMGGFVIVPRLLQAREPDEFREILTRDITTVATILFAMKGIKSGMCTAAQKKGGITLVSDAVGKDAGFLKRLGGYLNPEGGIQALGSDEILARYSNIKTKDALINTLQTVSDEGGNIGKMFSVEKQTGILDKIKEHLPFATKKNQETPLLNAAKKLFGDGFETKSNEELIGALKNLAPDNTEAISGLTEIIGDGANKLGILNSKNNPITNYARNISANFETLSLILTASILGLGLPKLNENLTKKRHLNQPVETKAVNVGYEPKKYGPQTPTIRYNTENVKYTSKLYSSLNKSEENPFKNFMA